MRDHNEHTNPKLLVPDPTQHEHDEALMSSQTMSSETNHRRAVDLRTRGAAPRRMRRAAKRAASKTRRQRTARGTDEGAIAHRVTRLSAPVATTDFNVHSVQHVVWIRECGLGHLRALELVEDALDLFGDVDLLACIVPTAVYDSVEENPIVELQNSSFTGSNASDDVLSSAVRYYHLLHQDVDGEGRPVPFSRFPSLADVVAMRNTIAGAGLQSCCELSLAAQFALGHLAACSDRFSTTEVEPMSILRTMIAETKLVAMLDPRTFKR